MEPTDSSACPTSPDRCRVGCRMETTPRHHQTTWLIERASHWRTNRPGPKLGWPLLFESRHRTAGFLASSGLWAPRLIAKYGADIRLPDLREQIAICSRH